MRHKVIKIQGNKEEKRVTRMKILFQPFFAIAHNVCIIFLDIVHEKFTNFTLDSPGMPLCDVIMQSNFLIQLLPILH